MGGRTGGDEVEGDITGGGGGRGGRGKWGGRMEFKQRGERDGRVEEGVRGGKKLLGRGGGRRGVVERVREVGEER